ncbi:MAG: hypothetical protein HC800_06035 [Phormidesmis sp. RL_2_1]|nr:hypothetical protein [Phormidesmis sp. RL_2_1]
MGLALSSASSAALVSCRANESANSGDSADSDGDTTDTPSNPARLTGHHKTLVMATAANYPPYEYLADEAALAQLLNRLTQLPLMLLAKTHSKLSDLILI